jgi:excisionase family DNA binding protein
MTNLKGKEKKIKSSSGDSLLKVKEVAEKFSIHVRTVYKWVQHGILPKPIKIGGATRFLESSIDVLMEELKKGGK